jgi:hypothetical protein
MNGLSSKIRGLEICMQAVVDFDALTQRGFRMDTERTDRGYGPVLKSVHCGSFRGHKGVGNAIKYARALDNARQLVGSIENVAPGGPTNTIDIMIAQDRAGQMGGSMEGRLLWPL